MLGTIWFCLVAIMLAGYVVLDGFDIGTGILHLWIARNDSERRILIRSIGPVWDANEVWLLAGGGTLFFAFPALYADSFSGFYLPLIMVLWLLIFRGISLEFRSHTTAPLWSTFWDGVFTVASVLLAIFYGAALGNVVRGVPFDSSGRFFEPLWTNFLPTGQTGILDWFTVLIGVAALMALTLHGATWVAYKTEGELHSRALQAATRIWWIVVILTIAVTFASFRLAPVLFLNFRSAPWGFVFPILAVAGLLGVQWFARTKEDGRAFCASCVYLVGMLTSVAFSLYPRVLPSSSSPLLGLTVENSQAAAYGLEIGLIWWVIGMFLVLLYTVYVHRSFAGKIKATETESQHGGY